MATRRTGKPKGRPPVEWGDDPDRYAVALIAALDALEATSIRQSALLAAVLMLDKPVGDNGFEKITGPDESAVTEEGRADALRRKYRTAAGDPASARWIVTMAGIFMLLIGAKDWEKVEHASLRRASVLGEQDFVRALIAQLRPAD